MADRIICISQARMTSTRLPGKIMKQVLGRTLLDYHVSRILKSRLIDRLVIATTTNAGDDPIEAFARAKNVDYVRGSEHDVLSRFHLAAEKYSENISGDVIVRVTSDCPLIDPALLDQVVGYFLDHRDQYDYVRTGHENYPRGLDVEVFSRAALEKAYSHGNEAHEREHVTPYIYREGSEFRWAIFPSTQKSGDHRWCVDEPADFELVKNILSFFEGRDDFSWQDCLALVEKHPRWYDINSHIHQKTLKQ